MIESYAREMAEQSMREIASAVLERGVALEPTIQGGPAAAEICRYAEQHLVDLIVTSTHGRTGLAHALIGSSAEYVVRQAHCPVLIVPTRKSKGGKS